MRYCPACETVAARPFDFVCSTCGKPFEFIQPVPDNETEPPEDAISIVGYDTDPRFQDHSPDTFSHESNLAGPYRHIQTGTIAWFWLDETLLNDPDAMDEVCNPGGIHLPRVRVPLLTARPYSVSSLYGTRRSPGRDQHAWREWELAVNGTPHPDDKVSSRDSFVTTQNDWKVW